MSPAAGPVDTAGGGAEAPVWELLPNNSQLEGTGARAHAAGERLGAGLPSLFASLRAQGPERTRRRDRPREAEPLSCRNSTTGAVMAMRPLLLLRGWQALCSNSASEGRGATRCCTATGDRRGNRCRRGRVPGRRSADGGRTSLRPLPVLPPPAHLTATALQSVRQRLECRSFGYPQ